MMRGSKGLNLKTNPSPSHLLTTRAKMANGRAMKLGVLFLAIATVSAQDPPREDGVVMEDYLEQVEKEGIITRAQVEQLKRLAGDLNEPETLKTDRGREPETPSVFMHMYNQLTLLNVLYFSGGVLIIGAYSLFMTLAWEMCGGGWISTVMTIQVVISGVIGIRLWFTEEWQFLGGL